MFPTRYEQESLIGDPLHGYIAYLAASPGEVAEQTLIDHPWVQRLRRIHQLHELPGRRPGGQQRRLAREVVGRDAFGVGVPEARSRISISDGSSLTRPADCSSD